MSDLNEKQLRFVEAYLLDPNATQAAIAAGYSKNTAYSQGQRLLKHVEVARLIKQAKEERSARTKIDADWVLENAKSVFERCMQTEPVLDREGNETGEYRFEHAGANKALEIIGKHVDVQAFKERIEHDVTDKLADTLARARRRAARAKQAE